MQQKLTSTSVITALYMGLTTPGFCSPAHSPVHTHARATASTAATAQPKIAPGRFLSVGFSLGQGENVKYYTAARQEIAYCTHALGVTPDDAKLLLRRAIAYNKLSKFQLAIPDFSRVIALHPKSADAYMGRAWAYDQLDNFQGAELDYKKYMSLGNQPYRGQAAYNLSDNLAQQGKTKEALSVLNALIKEYPDAGQPRRLRGTLQNGDGGNLKQSVEDYTVAINQKMHAYQDLYPMRANAYTRLKEYPKAIADYTAIIKASPTDDNAYRLRAAVYELMGDYKKAIDDYSIGIEMSMDNAGPCYFARSRCYKKLGQPALAQKDLDECKKLNYSGK